MRIIIILIDFLVIIRKLNEYSGIIAAIATIIIALIAVFGERIRLVLFGAKIKIKGVDCKVAYTEFLKIDKPIKKLGSQYIYQDYSVLFQAEAVWVRVVIENWGKNTAKGCEARLNKVLDEENEIKEFDPISLHWVGRKPEIINDEDARIDIRPKAKEKFDVCYVFKYKNIIAGSSPEKYEISVVSGSCPDEFNLPNAFIYDPGVFPRGNKIDLSKSNKVKIEIEIFTEDLKPIKKEIIIDFDKLRKIEGIGCRKSVKIGKLYNFYLSKDSFTKGD